jgi:hypothetical protein
MLFGVTPAKGPVGHPFSEKRRAEKNQTRMPKAKKTAARRIKLLVFCFVKKIGRVLTRAEFMLFGSPPYGMPGGEDPLRSSASI